MQKSNEKFVSSSAASSSNTDGVRSTTLSRNALYSPLVAYEQTQVDPALYMGNQKTIPSSLKESALSSFLQSVGEDYHRNRATGPDPKNNGSRPLSVSDMDDRLRQRVVTLVGGGINSSMASSNRQPRSKAKVRKRYRREWDQVKESISVKSTDTSIDSLSFLQQLNGRWNVYMLEMLGLNSKFTAKIEASILKSRLTAARSSMELAGAHIQIKECTQKRDLVGTFGVVVGETNNTWCIAIRSRPRARRRRRKVATSGSNDGDNLKPETKDSSNSKLSESSLTETATDVVTVPKRGSSLDVILPLPSQETKETKGEDKACSGVTPIIEQVAKSIFITLRPSEATDKFS